MNQHSLQGFFLMILIVLTSCPPVFAQDFVRGYAYGKYKFGIQNHASIRLRVHIYDNETGLNEIHLLGQRGKLLFDQAVSENTWIEISYPTEFFQEDTTSIIRRLRKLTQGRDQTESMYRFLQQVAANIPITETVRTDYWGNEVSRTNNALELGLFQLFMMASAEQKRAERQNQIRYLIRRFEALAAMYHASNGVHNEFSQQFQKKNIYQEVRKHPAFKPAMPSLMLRATWGAITGKKLTSDWSKNRGGRLTANIGISPEIAWNRNRSQSKQFSRFYLSLAYNMLNHRLGPDQEVFLGDTFIEGETSQPAMIPDTANKRVHIKVPQYDLGLNFFSFNTKSGIYFELEGGMQYRPHEPYVWFPTNFLFFPGTQLSINQNKFKSTAELSENKFRISPYATVGIGLMGINRWKGSVADLGFNIEASVYQVGLAPLEGYQIYTSQENMAGNSLLALIPLSPSDAGSSWAYSIRLGLMYAL